MRVELTITVEGGEPIPAYVDIRTANYPRIPASSAGPEEGGHTLVNSGIVQCPDLDIEIQKYLDKLTEE